MTSFLRRSFVLLAAFAIAACSRSENAGSAKPAESPAGSSGSAAGSLASTSGAVLEDSISAKADAGRIAGAATSNLWVIMASDFQCPYCKQWHDLSFAPVMEYAKAGKVRIAFINMPLSIHPNAMPAAEAAMCASVQNKFWPMHDALFASQGEWAAMPNPASKFDALAAAAGVNMAPWRDCVAKHATVALINADRERARTAGVGSTPTFFVNGKMVVNAEGQSAGAAADVRAAIEAALKTPR